MDNKLVVILSESFDNYFREWATTHDVDYTDEEKRETALMNFFYYNYNDIIDTILEDVEEALYDRCEEILKKDGKIK